MFAVGSVKDRTLIQPRTPNVPAILPSVTMRSLVRSSRAGSGTFADSSLKPKPQNAHKAPRAPCETMLCGRSSLLSVLLHEARDALGKARTFAHPVVDAVELQFELALFSCRNRVVEAHLLQDRSALAVAAVGNHDVVEGLLFRPAAGEPNRNHAAKASNSLRNSASPQGRSPGKGGGSCSNGAPTARFSARGSVVWARDAGYGLDIPASAIAVLFWPKPQAPRP